MHLLRNHTIRRGVCPFAIRRWGPAPPSNVSGGRAAPAASGPGRTATAPSQEPKPATDKRNAAAAALFAGDMGEKAASSLSTSHQLRAAFGQQRDLSAPRPRLAPQRQLGQNPRLLLNWSSKMKSRASLLTIAFTALPLALAAQGTAAAAAPASKSPVADGLRGMHQRFSGILIAAAEAMPADKYNYRPTPAQMSFAQIQVHLANEGNDVLCGKTAGVEVPARAKVDSTATKEQLVARLKETFVFCEQAFAKMDDSKLAEPVSMFGMNMTRAVALLITVGDWADHYSQESNYLRLNHILAPTAEQRM